jgi:hypothetical protein
MNKIDLKKPTAINDDFALWATEQGALLRAGRLDRVDVENVAEEIESLGRSEEDQIDSRLEKLLQHLLKWQFQPEERTNSWGSTLLEQRLRIRRLIERSPSLKRYPAQSMKSSYVLGRAEAIKETGLKEAIFPADCPYSAEQTLDFAFFPGPKEPFPETAKASLRLASSKKRKS